MAYQSAIIGYGGMGSWHHRSISEKVPRIQVAAAYDVRPEALKKVKEAGLKAYDTLDELLCDQSIDLVTIATPNNFHMELAIRALKAGKNVVCEKPVTLCSEELTQIINVAQKTGKLFSVHQNRRWDKDYRIVKETIKRGLIGKPYFIESKVQGSRRAMYGWRGYKLNGGGMLLDWGVHLIDQMMNLFDCPVTSVSAQLLSVFKPEVDDNIKLMLTFDNGCSALLEMATNCLILQPRWHVTGTEGTLEIEDWSCKGKIVTLEQNAEMTWDDDIVYTEAGPTRTMAPRPAHTTKELALPQVVTDWSDYYNNICDVLDGKAELIVTPEQALRVMKVVDLLFESDKQGHGLPCRI